MSPAGREEKPEGLSKYLERMKSVFRPRSARRQSLAADLAAPTQSTPPITPTPAATPAPKAKAKAPESSIPQPVMITDYSRIHHEKARTLFAKYGLTLNQADGKPHSELQLTRVTKPIRMRVRRTCHRCETTFGAEKLCINCQHTRCTKCPRHPAAREQPSARKPKLPEPSIPQSRLFLKEPRYQNLSHQVDLPFKKSSRTDGQNYVHKPTRQRVHRYCHFCKTAFTPGSKSCPDCNHTRCKLCPRDPAKLNKYPDGYAGDADPPKPGPNRTFRKTRHRVHYACHVCETRYQGPSGKCSNCGQVKCAESIRIPPKKTKPEPSPEVLRSIQEKLARLEIRQTDPEEPHVEAKD